MTKNEKISLKLKQIWQNPTFREKMSMSQKGHTPWNKGLKTGLVPRSAFKVGYRRTKEQEIKRILALTKDITQLKICEDKRSTIYNFWRKQVKNRDNWKCKINNEDCSGQLEAHHILGFTKFPELRYEINNGITLCHAHHPRGRAEEARLAPVLQDMISAIANQYAQ